MRDLGQLLQYFCLVMAAVVSSQNSGAQALQAQFERLIKRGESGLAKGD